MKPQEVRNLTEPEIENKILSIKEELFNLRSEISTGRVERPHRFRLLKRDIQRCNTILKEKQNETNKA